MDITLLCVTSLLLHTEQLGAATITAMIFWS